MKIVMVLWPWVTSEAKRLLGFCPTMDQLGVGGQQQPLAMDAEFQERKRLFKECNSTFPVFASF